MTIDPAEQEGRPFEQLRSEQFAAPGWVLVGVCALDVLAGVALAASWKWPIAAGWIGVVGGLLGAALGGLDIAGRRTAYPSD